MVANVIFPLKFHRVAGIYFCVVMILSVISTIRLTVTQSVIMAILTYVSGMLDFSIMFWSMKKALHDKPEKSLKIMRDGMGLRFVVALMTTVAAIKLNYMPWAVLLGLLMIHVVVLVDSVLVSIKSKK